MDPLDAVILRASCQKSRPFVITLDDYTISTTSGVEPLLSTKVEIAMHNAQDFQHTTFIMKLLEQSYHKQPDRKTPSFYIFQSCFHIPDSIAFRQIFEYLTGDRTL